MFKCVSVVEKGKIGILSKTLSLGRETLAWASSVSLERGLGEGHEFGSVIPPSGRKNLAWASNPRLGDRCLAWARKPRIWMSPWKILAWARKVSLGSSMMIPHPDAYIDDSFTLPPKILMSSEDGFGYPSFRSDGTGPSQDHRTWPDGLDALSSSRAGRSSGLGGGPCKKTSVLRMSSPPNYASGIWHHDMEEDEEEEEDEVIELVDVESSVEVIDLVSDSEEEEDPSEGSSIPGIF
ncbi:unnamed protein product [Lupinus luteus]|uniref:Uncharacterized protein n=1 Tax=Lupinus luteus TaxID=3873 RepID=A0AAV1WUH5_LUPLU